MIGLSQRPPPNNTLQSQQTDIHNLAGFEPTIPASELPQKHALDRAAADIGYPALHFGFIVLIGFLCLTHAKYGTVLCISNVCM